VLGAIGIAAELAAEPDDVMLEIDVPHTEPSASLRRMLRLAMSSTAMASGSSVAVAISISCRTSSSSRCLGAGGGILSLETVAMGEAGGSRVLHGVAKDRRQQDEEDAHGVRPTDERAFDPALDLEPGDPVLDLARCELVERCAEQRREVLLRMASVFGATW
jgi:hypothetical protein